MESAKYEHLLVSAMRVSATESPKAPGVAAPDRVAVEFIGLVARSGASEQTAQTIPDALERSPVARTIVLDHQAALSLADLLRTQVDAS